MNANNSLPDFVAPAPATVRGYRIDVGLIGNYEWIVYPSGWLVTIRKLNSPFKAITYSAHQCEVKCVSVAPNDRQIASGDAKGVIKIWEFNPKEFKIYEYNSFNTFTIPILQVAWNTQSSKVALANEKGFIKVISVEIGTQTG